MGLMRELLAVSFLLAGSASMFVAIEGWSVTDAVYFSGMVAKTVGFGDVVPQEPLGRFTMAALSILAPGVTAVLMGRVASELGLTRRNIALTAIALGVAGTFSYQMLEGNTLQEAAMTILALTTTCGWGDVVPATDAGKIFLVVFGLVSNGVMAVFFNDVVKDWVLDLFPQQ